MAKNIPKYYPLNLIYDLDQISDNWRYKNYIKSLSNFPGLDLKDFPQARDEFIKEGLKYGFNPVKDYIQKIITFYHLSLKQRGGELNACDYKDLIVYPLIIEKWSDNKQVFKPDVQFLSALEKTDNFKLDKETMEHLPINTFYLDLEDYNKTFAGAFVDIIPLETEVYFTVYSMTKEKAQFSNYFYMTYDQDGNINTDDLVILIKDNSEVKLSTLFFDDESGEIFKSQYDTDKKLSPTKISAIVMQLLCYLTSKEPDIQESEKTKRTYKKPIGEPKNSFKEVQIHDVGIRYGKTIRAFIREEKKKHHVEIKDTDEVEIIKVGNKRKSPRLHFRCAHWQRYRVGKGRKEIVTKWVAPMYIGAGNKNNADVVIHKVKE